jgi:probable rRNA maturation factor
VQTHGCELPLPRRVVRLVIAGVLAGERRAPAAVSVTFLSAPRMRALNRRALGTDRVTDVIAFGMAHAGQQAADIYVCPATARAASRAFGVPVGEELVRLIVHGLLHALGYDHPSSPRRTRSRMWRRQERYVRRLVAALR